MRRDTAFINVVKRGNRERGGIRNYDQSLWWIQSIKWASACQNLQEDLSDQRRLRSICASVFCWSHVPYAASGLSKQETLPYRVVVQVDLSLCCSHRFYCRFCRAPVQMIQLSGTQHFLQECMCAQQRHRSKCANGQSNQKLGRALFGYQCTFRRTAKSLNFLVGNAVLRTIYHYEPATKPTKWHVRPAKTQIGLGICPVWSNYSRSAWRKLGSLVTHWAHSKDSEQTGWIPRLIWVFAGRTCHFVGYFVRWLIWYFDNHH